jgi:DNA-binding response OmpR family regulator
MSDILIIDDDAAVRITLQRVLQAAGFRVRAAADGEEGVAEFRRQNAVLVITDIFMPEKDGLEVIRELRSLAPSLPILVTSGRARAGRVDFLETAIRLGASDVLAKPFDAEAIVSRVRQMLRDVVSCS